MTERNYNFTGKSDFFDWCNMLHNPEEIISKADVFLGNAQVKLNTPEDLIPYYTNLVASAGCSKDHQNINLSTESFLDSEEINECRNYDKFILYDTDVQFLKILFRLIDYYVGV